MTGGPARVLIRHFFSILAVLAGITVIQASEADIILPQANGETLVLPGPAQRIITLAPNLAEILFAAGAGDHLKAVVEYSNFPRQVVDIQRVGDAFRIDLERIVELEPDLVIAWSSGNPQSALKKLEQLGIRVWQLEINRPEQIAEAVEYMSIAAGTENVGRAKAKRLASKLTELKRNNLNKTPVRYFYQVASHPLYTVNGEHIISKGLALCGGQNIFSQLAVLAPQVSHESVILANPEVLISAQDGDGRPALEIWNDWPRLQAVKKDNMLYLPADQVSQATPRFLDSIALACQYLDEVRSTNAIAIDTPLGEVQHP